MIKKLFLLICLTLGSSVSYAQTAPVDTMTHFTPTQVRTIYAHILTLERTVTQKDSLIALQTQGINRRNRLIRLDSLIIGSQRRQIEVLRTRDSLYVNRVVVLEERAWYDSSALKMLLGGLVSLFTYITVDTVISN